VGGHVPARALWIQRLCPWGLWILLHDTVVYSSWFVSRVYYLFNFFHFVSIGLFACVRCVKFYARSWSFLRCVKFYAKNTQRTQRMHHTQRTQWAYVKLYARTLVALVALRYAGNRPLLGSFLCANAACGRGTWKDLCTFSEPDEISFLVGPRQSSCPTDELQYTVESCLDWSTFHSLLCSGPTFGSHCTVGVPLLLRQRLGFEG